MTLYSETPFPLKLTLMFKQKLKNETPKYKMRILPGGGGACL